MKHATRMPQRSTKLYLKESPDGPEAGQVRASLARVTTNLSKPAQIDH